MLNYNYKASPTLTSQRCPGCPCAGFNAPFGKALPLSRTRSDVWSLVFTGVGAEFNFGLSGRGLIIGFRIFSARIDQKGTYGK